MGETFMEIKRTETTSSNDLDAVTLLTAEQVAGAYGVHKRTVWRLVATGDIPQPIRIGRRIVRWRLSDLQQHVQLAKAG
jgi:predicted DNA-binding transcriptional regulator AlpA